MIHYLPLEQFRRAALAARALGGARHSPVSLAGAIVPRGNVGGGMSWCRARGAFPSRPPMVSISYGARVGCCGNLCLRFCGYPTAVFFLAKIRRRHYNAVKTNRGAAERWTSSTLAAVLHCAVLPASDVGNRRLLSRYCAGISANLFPRSCNPAERSQAGHDVLIRKVGDSPVDLARPKRHYSKGSGSRRHPGSWPRSVGNSRI